MCSSKCTVNPCSLIRTTEYGIRTADYGVRNTEYGIRNTEYGIRTTEYEIRNTEYDSILCNSSTVLLATALNTTPAFGTFASRNSFELQSERLHRRGTALRVTPLNCNRSDCIPCKLNCDVGSSDTLCVCCYAVALSNILPKAPLFRRAFWETRREEPFNDHGENVPLRIVLDFWLHVKVLLPVRKQFTPFALPRCRGYSDSLYGIPNMHLAGSNILLCLLCRRAGDVLTCSLTDEAACGRCAVELKTRSSFGMSHQSSCRTFNQHICQLLLV